MKKKQSIIEAEVTSLNSLLIVKQPERTPGKEAPAAPAHKKGGLKKDARGAAPVCHNIKIAVANPVVSGDPRRILEGERKKACRQNNERIYKAVWQGFWSAIRFLLLASVVYVPLLYDIKMHAGEWRSEIEGYLMVFGTMFAILLLGFKKH